MPRAGSYKTALSRGVAVLCHHRSRSQTLKQGRSYEGVPYKGIKPLSTRLNNVQGTCPRGRVTLNMRNPETSDQVIARASGRWPDPDRTSKMPTIREQPTLSLMVSIVRLLLNQISRKGCSHGRCKMPSMYCISQDLVLYNEYVVVTDGWPHIESSSAYSHIPMIYLPNALGSSSCVRLLSDTDPDHLLFRDVLSLSFPSDLITCSVK